VFFFLLIGLTLLNLYAFRSARPREENDGEGVQA
jgi:hypothetical protein